MGTKRKAMSSDNGKKMQSDNGKKMQKKSETSKTTKTKHKQSSDNNGTDNEFKLVGALAVRAREASLKMQTASAQHRNAALVRIHTALSRNENRAAIIEANKLDLDAAVQNNLSPQLIKRLDLSSKDKFDSMIQGVKDIADMPDPVGRNDLATKLDDDLELFRVSCPIGVILIIFEARPEVVVNIAALTIKSGNAVILKGGKEAQHSNAILAKIISDAISDDCGNVGKDAVLLVESRTAIDVLLGMDKQIDLVIPRGSNQLVRHVQGNTRIPVLGHADGICTTYLDETLDEEKAIRIIIDAKTTAPSACNSTETLLIHKFHLETPFFITLLTRLAVANISLRIDPEIISAFPVITATIPTVTAATPEDFDTEFLDTILAVRAVASVDDAISHINLHGSHHTDAIVTASQDAADTFLRGVDSADVFWNASTRFADGFRFGFGAEIGVSTNKTHARGPVGVEGLMIYKYRLHGNGHCTADYGEGVGRKSYKHDALDIDSKRFQL
ncbi:hypothetical protein HK100_009770 [Physocladia obscura]|uniref:glutamate-5-semialdehyde dehydrogenase n=1 Tax=Physocladia obscura TaxID=109957 RepID=A0AAD5XHV1_9FUNG|nr:hypothetical protein HK100_009770 [Physocladia obscura]